MSAPLTFHLLGGAAISYGDEPLGDLRSRTAEALLIYLACHERPLSRQFLADFFWDDRSQTQAAANLRAILSMLRKQVNDYLTADRHTISFNHQKPHWLDTALFERQMRQLEPHLNLAPNLDAETSNQLEELLALYQGDFLASFYLNESRGFEEWVVVMRERLRRLAVLGLRRLVHHFLLNGRYQTGISYADRLVEADPYLEEAQRWRMWLLLRSGRRNAALQSYHTFKALLADDLGVEPSPATTAVYEQITALTFPPPHNIPAGPTPFIGREAEISDLQASLSRPESRLITIVGPGGAGKTRLATQVAHQITTLQPGAFLHGVWFIPLAPVLSADFLVTAVAHTLNLAFRGTASPQDQLLAYLQNREMLLILDNFEHLLVGDAGSLALLSDILEQAPHIKLLVTSREQLNLREEQIFDIEGLPYPTDPTLSPESAAAYSAVALFLQSAGRISRRFAPNKENIAAIIQLCRLLEGMPLGLEMAAVWVRQESVAQILAHLQQNFDSLETTWFNVPHRHRSLRAVFDHSWRLLTAEEQRGFARLAVFQGGFSPAAALTVAGVSRPSVFQGKSLLRRDENGRFDLHNLIHQFTAEILQQDSAALEAIQKNHAHYYLQLLHRQESLLVGPSAEEAHSLIAREIENIRLAWQWALTHGNLELLNQGYLSLYQFYEMRGWLDEGHRHFTQTVTALTAQLGAVEQASEQAALIFGRLQARAGWFTYRIGQLTLAREMLEECQQRFRRLAAQKDLAQCLSDLGLLARRNGDYANARDLFLESLALRREMNDRLGVAVSLNNLANAVRFLGEYEAARAYSLESLELLQEEGNLLLLANVTNDLGETARATGNYEEARKYLEASLAVRQQIGTQPGIAMCLNNLGSVAHTLGDYESARRYAQESLAIDIATADKRAAPYPLSVLGRIARDEGDFAASLSSFRRALQICQEINYIPKALDILFEMATVLEAMNQPAEAVRLLAFVSHHPKINYETRSAAQELSAKLSALIPQQTAAEMQQQGRAETLDTATTRVLRRDWLAGLVENA